MNEKSFESKIVTMMEQQRDDGEADVAQLSPVDISTFPAFVVKVQEIPKWR